MTGEVPPAPDAEDLLLRVVAEAQARGWVGPGPTEDQIRHARGFFEGRPVWLEGWVADLGSGGGLPGLALALAYPLTQWLLVDAWQRRTDVLEGSVRELGLAARVQVRHARAEDLARGVWRGAFDLVVARGLGGPSVTAECAAGLLRRGGELIVSDRGESGRWPTEGLAALGMAHGVVWQIGHWWYRSIVQEQPCPDQYPRRAGVPERRPLF